ncbi:hypothetical protein Dda_1468 [Drechslerella dactyloides]|uniref:ATP-dependent RNA helicase n=1 Tax=Drechslerella dactyloides TaxID=74499 RepID=A0AAD6J234_DREDA|nr:hypothetical protein Dda_1468 [Drechslerella dactyloides]
MPLLCAMGLAVHLSLEIHMSQLPCNRGLARTDGNAGSAPPHLEIPDGPRRFQDESPEDGEDLAVDFDSSRYDVAQPSRMLETPDLQSIMANSRASDFARQLHKLRREELERRDPAMQILSKLQTPNTFEESSIRPAMKKALAKAFPNVKALSPTQKNLLPLLQEGYSLCATGPPGSGKSFAIAVWLLQMMRSIKSTIMPNGDFRKTPITTALLFVPHVDLLHQYMRLLEILYNAFGEPGQAIPPKEAVFQGLTRYGSGFAELESEQIRTLAKYPSPHIIVTTPTRLLDILNDPDSKALLDLTSLRVIAADEVDAMISQRPTPQRLNDMTQPWKKRQDLRWKKQSPMELCVDFILAKREMRASQRGDMPEPIQFCCVSPNLSPVLKSKLIYIKKWVGFSESNAKANSLVNLGIQDFSKMFDQDKLAPIVHLPSRITHYALSVDITSGMMRDIPRYNEDALIRSQDERAEIQKYVGILKSHKDPRVKDMSKEALVVEAAQEKVLTEEEGSLDKYKYDVNIEGHPEVQVRDIVTSLPNDFRHTGIPRNVAIEAMDVLLKRDNYPERVLMYVSPIASRGSFVDALAEAGFNAQHVRMENCEQHGISIGRSDIPQPPLPEEPDVRVRTKADTTIWVASSVSLRGIDLPHFTHAYIMIPTTGYQKYAQMAGRIARYPFTKQMGDLPEPKGQVTTIFLEQPSGEHDLAPIVDGVIQIDSPVEGLAWRRIHRMYGLCGAKVDKYFGVDEPNGVMLKSPANHLTKYPGMDNEIPWEHEMETPESGSEEVPAGCTFQEARTYMDMPNDMDSILSGDEAIKARPNRDSTTTTTPSEPSAPDSSTVTEPIVPSSEPIDATKGGVSVDLGDESSELFEVLASKEAPDAIEETQEGSATDEISPESEQASSEIAEDEGGVSELPAAREPIELQDGPHFAPEDADESSIQSALTESASDEIAQPAEVSQNPTEIPLEVAEGVTEEEVKEFQQAQDEIFSAFLELNVLQEQMRKAKEGDASVTENTASEQQAVGATKEDELSQSSFHFTIARYPQIPTMSSPHKSPNKHKENVYKSPAKTASPAKRVASDCQPAKSDPPATTHKAVAIDQPFGGYMPWEENEFADIAYGRHPPKGPYSCGYHIPIDKKESEEEKK